MSARLPNGERPQNPLTEREFSVAMQFAHGANYKEIAAALKITTHTVKAYRRLIGLKLGLFDSENPYNSISQRIVAWAYENGHIKPKALVAGK